MIGNAFPIYNGLAPLNSDGGVDPKCFPMTLDFTSVASIEIDLTLENMAGVINAIQTLYVSNTDNPGAVTFVFQGTGQKLVIEPGQSGYFPITTGQKLFCVASCAVDPDAIVPIQFLNVPMPAFGWGPITVNVASVTATFTPTVGTFADASGNIAAGGVSQNLFAANAAAIRRVVQNPTSNIESIYINFGGVAASAANSIEITPGGEFDTGTGPIDQTAWKIIAATLGTTYVAKEMT